MEIQIWIASQFAGLIKFVLGGKTKEVSCDGWNDELLVSSQSFHVERKRWDIVYVPSTFTGNDK